MSRREVQTVPDRLLALLVHQGMPVFASKLSQQQTEYFRNITHGDFPQWQVALNCLPAISPSVIDLNKPAIQIGIKTDCTDAERELLAAQLRLLMPWRKGPFNWFGIDLDTEWRSNLKWERFINDISSLKDRLILDVGSGNGYYGWRMLGESARAVVGIEPTLRFVMQFQAANTYINQDQIHLFPFRLEQLLFDSLSFDTVFSMGVLYHQRDPMLHLETLYRCLRSGGELVLETLVIDQDGVDLLKPKGRYAKMNNVWNIPGCRLLLEWVMRCHFCAAEIIDVSVTTNGEQRSTTWMEFESLADFLDPDDPAKTIEGYPAPRRAILIARKP